MSGMYPAGGYRNAPKVRYDGRGFQIDPPKTNKYVRPKDRPKRGKAKKPVKTPKVDPAIKKLTEKYGKPRIPKAIRPPKVGLPMLPGTGFAKKVLPLFKLHPFLRVALNILELLPNPWAPVSPGEYDMSGWTLHCDNGLGPHYYYRQTLFNPNLSCGTSFQVPTAPLTEQDITFPSNCRWIAFGRYQDIGPNNRMALDQQWTRTTNLRSPLPYNNPGFALPSAPPVQPPYAAIPHRKKSPDRGYGESPAPRPRFRPRRPPGPRVKEKKFNMGIDPKSLAGKAISGITETLDGLNCLHGALPPKYQAPRGSKASPQSKGKALYKNLDKVSLPKAVTCFIENHIEDHVIGKFGSAARAGQASAYKKGYLGRMNLATGPGL